MCFLPRRALNVSECEIARAYKVISSASYSWIEPIAFVVPRKADSFQADIFPPAPSTEPSLTAGEFFSGREEITRKVVDLSSGVTSAATALPPTITLVRTSPSFDACITIRQGSPACRCHTLNLIQDCCECARVYSQRIWIVGYLGGRCTCIPIPVHT
jgi:hypothetical protein